MSKINFLSEELINKIAAGEVIERPASIVKELVENSLDAKATKIMVKIENYGKDLIQVIDNGEGMDQEDAKRSILRHATSKINTSEDLFSINTLGFRGEALASIAAVSRLNLITNKREQLEGYHLSLEGGVITNSNVIAAEPGTTIEVKDLFFNTPVRKKFLKSDAVELRHIIDVITNYALIHPEISFNLVHNNNRLLYAPEVEDLKSNVAFIYGLGLINDLLELEYQDGSVNISGCIVKPYQARNDKNQQAIFINKRWVRNNDLVEAVYEAYHSLLFINKHPIFILNLELNPKKIDVNVHPQKMEIKIEQKDQICRAVLLAVKRTLQQNNLIPATDLNFEQQLTFGILERKETLAGAKYLFEKSTQAVLGDSTATDDHSTLPDLDSNSFLAEHHADSSEDCNENSRPDHCCNQSSATLNLVPEYSSAKNNSGNLKLPPMKILGQIHKTFFVAETVGGMLLIDQHVVQERVLYEKFMQQLMNKNVSVQTLLQPELLDFTPAEKVMIIEHQDSLQQLGFALDHFGENTFVLKTVPSLFGRTQSQEIIYDLLQQFNHAENSITANNKLEHIQEEIITRMACRASVKAGDVMTIPEIQRLLDELAECNLPYTCPHGRAIIIKIPVEELEKKFKRK